MSPDEKLVIEGGRVKVVSQSRQTEAVKAGQSGVIVDYLRFTIKRDEAVKTKVIPLDSEDQDLTRYLALQFAGLLGYQLGEDRKGRDYYEYTSTIENEHGQEMGSVSGGGHQQRGTICFTLKGEGCTFARERWERRVHEYFAELCPKVTRIDLARDFYEGEVCIDEITHAYEHGSFDYRNRRPSHCEYGVWKAFPGETPNSRTFQVGKRESGKLFRGYEKGHQYADMASKWLRCEVELRSVNRVIPWESLVEPGGYFAGAYEFAAWVSNHPVRVEVCTATMVANAGADAAVRWMERVVAPTLSVFAACTDNLDWLMEMCWEHRNRRMPRALRGMDKSSIKVSLQAALAKFSDVGVPATNGYSPAPA